MMHDANMVFIDSKKVNYQELNKTDPFAYAKGDPRFPNADILRSGSKIPTNFYPRLFLSQIFLTPVIYLPNKL